MVYALVKKLLLPSMRATLGEVTGLENVPASGGIIIAANHIDFLDGFFITAALADARKERVRFLSKTANYWWTGGATIPIDWNDKNGSLEKSLHLIEHGALVTIFPEGSRNASGTIGRCKTGVARMALRTGVAVLPIGLVGASGSSMWNSITKFGFGRERMAVHIGTPLLFAKVDEPALREELLRSTVDAIMQNIATLSKKTYQP